MAKKYLDSTGLTTLWAKIKSLVETKFDSIDLSDYLTTDDKCRSLIIKDNYTSISNGSNLNSPEYMHTGVYRGTSVDSMTNCPTSTQFRMEVYDPTGDGSRNAETATWVYRVRKILDLNGDQWIQRANSAGTAGTFSYGNWEKIIEYSDLSNYTGDLSCANLYLPENGYAYFGTDQLASFRANANGAFIVGSYGDMYFRPTLASNDSSSSVGVRLSQTMMRPEKTDTMALGAPSYAYKAVYAQEYYATKVNTVWANNITLTEGTWAVALRYGNRVYPIIVHIDDTDNADTSYFVNSEIVSTTLHGTAMDIKLKCTSATINGNYVFGTFAGSTQFTSRVTYRKIG